MFLKQPRVFLCHDSADKAFVRRLALDLDAQGIRCWIDEAEIRIGDSLLRTIEEGISTADNFALVLSHASMESPWVEHELALAMNQENLGRSIRVLPILIEKVDVPKAVRDTYLADFTEPANYNLELEKLVRSFGYVFNRGALAGELMGTSLGHAIDKAWNGMLPILSAPFHRPFQYMGMTVQQAAAAVGGTPNEVGNIIVDSDECHMCLEAEGNFVSYVDVELSRTAPHSQSKAFDSEVALGALSINPSELECVRKIVHSHTYMDHRRKLKISVTCLYEGAPLSVSFSGKYYAM